MIAEHDGEAGLEAVKLFVVRHGRTALNAAGLLRGRNDVDLDSVGQLEAARLATALADVELSRVVSSPLRRATATATPMALVHDLRVDVDDDLVDRDYGEWTGQPATDVVARFGSVDAAPGVEPRAVFERRVRRALDRWASKPTGGSTLLVGHDAVNGCLLRIAVPELADGDVGQHTGCWNELALDGERWRAVAINQVPDDS